jgi:hypothetical protein
MHVLLSGNRKFLFVVDKSCNSENFGGNYGSSSAEHELRGLKTFLAKESLLCSIETINYSTSFKLKENTIGRYLRTEGKQQTKQLKQINYHIIAALETLTEDLALLSLGQ